MPTKLSRTKSDLRVNRPAAPFAAKHGSHCEHLIDHVRFADRRAMKGDAVLRGEVLGHPAGGAVRDNRPLAAAQHVVQTQSERVFLADVPAGLVDHGQPVGIGILAETDVGPGFDHLLPHAREILGSRFRRMEKLAGRFAAQQHHFTAKRLQKPPPQDASRAGIAIEQDAKPPGLDCRHFDDCLDEPLMGSRSVCQRFDPTDPLVRHPLAAMPRDNAPAQVCPRRRE